MEHTQQSDMDQTCACCYRKPIHNTELPDWLRFVGRAATVSFCPEHKGWLDGLRRDERGRIVYTYRGGIERGTGGGYSWHDGYSPTTIDGGVLYPWMPLRKCQQDARRYGCKAAFEQGGVRFAAR